MVALALSSSSTGVSMVAWAFLGVVLAFCNAVVVVHAIPNVKYGGDVDGDEVVIDQLEDYIRSHDPQHLYVIDKDPPHPRQHYEHTRDKIKFAVSPKDPRYYEPIPLDQGPDLVEDLEEEERVGGGRGGVGGGGPPPPPPPPLPYLPPNLGALRSRLQSQREYHGEIPQYQDDDTQYPANQYVQEDQYNDPYPLRDPGYLSIQQQQQPDLVPFYGDPPLEVLEELQNEGAQRMRRPHIPEEVREEVERDEAKRMMASIGSDRGEEVDEDAAAAAAAAAAPLKMEAEAKKASIKAATSQPEAVNYLNRSPAHAQHSDYIVKDSDRQSEISDIYFTAIVAGCTAAAVCAVLGAGMCWYRLNKSHRAAQDAEYPAYGVTGPNKDLSPTSGDRKLAQSAHMYHYQHQKQQMINMDKSRGGERHGSASDVDSDEEGEENEYTVYECPGLAPTGEMEVKNPLFQDDPTPATPSLRKDQDDDDDDDDEDEEQKAK